MTLKRGVSGFNRVGPSPVSMAVMPGVGIIRIRTSLFLLIDRHLQQRIAYTPFLDALPHVPLPPGE